MTPRRRNWMAGIGVVVVLLAAGLAIAGSMLSARIEPQARQMAIRYLSQRFDSDVELRALHIRLSETSLLRVVLSRGRGISARLEGEGLSLRLKNRPDSARLLAIQKFHFEVSLESLMHPPVAVSEVFVDGMEVQIPPRQAQASAESAAGGETGSGQRGASLGVTIGKVIVRNAGLTIQSRNPQRSPLRFNIESLQLESGALGEPTKYETSFTNAEPPGKVHASGTLGPWRAGEPGDTPLTGDYRFEKADLGVFAGIAGTLDSTGQFAGQLSALTVHGEASVPNFRLRMSGNPVPLHARFTVLVDGANGNTTLQPVTATLGSTNFTTSGGIIRHEANQPRTIALDVAMPNGDLRDVLRLAMKGSPFMEGRLVLHTKLDIPPLTGKVREKLQLDGRFQVLEGKFLHSTIQKQIESLSQHGQGQQQNQDGDQVVSKMAGAFHLENAVIRFSELSFGVPGADIDLTGDYNLDSDALDFGGSLKLQATVSQMVTGWKRSVLRPIDRFFEKDGAGTFLNIRVDGTSRAPKFGVILGGKRLEAPLPKK